MSNDVTRSLRPDSSLGWTGRQAVAGLDYVGSLALLTLSALGRARTLGAGAFIGELSWVLRLGLPLVALVHVGIGSFLSMQSYFGGTFVEGTGAVVGVGLIRNVAPLMACLTLSGLLAARITPELKGVRRRNESGPVDRPGFLERTAMPTPPEPPRPSPRPADVAAPRLAAGMVAGLVFGVWGSAVGTAVGWQVASTMLGVSSHSFFQMFWEMLWLRDLAGLVIKGSLFGLVAAAFACHEGLRGSGDDDMEAVASSACRAACLSALTILVINSGWFILVYHAGPAFGPTLLSPPTS